MSEPNWTNQTLWTGDNIDVMRGMHYARDEVRVGRLDLPRSAHLLEPRLPSVDWLGGRGRGIVHGRPMNAYLIMMSVRLLEMKRILKIDGTVYLHCDRIADGSVSASWTRVPALRSN